jgi:hypothetical protein
MSFSRIAALATGILLVSSAANAASSFSRVNISDSFTIGIEGESYQYREPNLDEDIGGGLGLNGTYQLNLDKWFVRANIIAEFYDLDYSSNGTGSKNGDTDYMQDYRLMFGRAFGISHSSNLSPYFGIGFRVLFDSGKAATSSGAVGYDRRSEYLYIPVGATYNFKAWGWGMAPTAEYDYFVQGFQTSYLRDDGFDNNLYNHQNVGYGVRADFMVTPPVDFYNFSFGPYLRYWSIHDSDIQTLYSGGVAVETGLEPANNTTEVGLRATFRFQ